MKFTADAKLLSVSSRPGVKDPNKTYYPILFMQGTDTLDLLCQSEKVFEKAISFEPMADVHIVIEYNSKYRSLRLVDIAG